jgi:hypothetical protein
MAMVERRLLRRFCIAACCWLVLGAILGCDAAPIYTDDSVKTPIVKIPDRSKWTAQGTLKDPSHAVDGNLNSMAVAPDNVAGRWLMIDLGKCIMFNMVVIDHGRNEFGFAKRLAVTTSVDGQNFGPKPPYVAIGTRRVTTLLLPKSTFARYILLTVSEPGEKPWSVGDVYIQ